MALGESVRRGRERHPEQRALIFEQQSWTYAQLDEITDRLASSLLREGIQPGDRVALHFTNCPELMFGYYACFKIGAIAVPLKFRLKGPELEYVLNHSGARLFIGQEELFPEVQGVRSRLGGLQRYYVTGSAGAFAEVHPFAELLASSGEEAALPAVADETPAVILYTSGSTGRPKGVVHSHFSLERAIGWSTFEEADIVGLVSPLCHAGGFGQMLMTVSRGAASVLVPRADPERVLRALAEHRVTRFGGLPVMLNALLDCPGARAYDLSSVKMCAAGGDVVPIELQRRFQETFGVVILEGCGMTELPPMYSLNPPAAPKAGSIGRPVPGVSLRLVDEHGRDVPPGEIGEIWLKSDALMVGYWQDPEATAAVLQDGWLSTGDLARCDEDGYYWFTGRKKEIIIRGGSNISPAEVEDALYQHPAVREAGVIGVPDGTWGEVVHAFVALKKGLAVPEEALRQFVGQRLAAYKVPEAIHFVADLPLGPTGKVQRKTLREWA